LLLIVVEIDHEEVAPASAPHFALRRRPTKKWKSQPSHSLVLTWSLSHTTHDTMNAEAYLRKQGWQGSGHSLDSTGRGIKKPLLIAHKQDQLGLGKKKAAYTTDDQWWMRAYDQSLQSIGTGKEVHTCVRRIVAEDV
jgi:hypothetical protein